MKRNAIIFFLFSFTVGAIDPPPCGFVTCKRVYRQFETYIEAYNKAIQGMQGGAAPLVTGPVGVEQAVHDAVLKRVAALETELQAKGLVEADLNKVKGKLKKAEAQVLDERRRHGDFKQDTHAALQCMSIELLALKRVKDQLEAERKDFLAAIQAEAVRVRTEVIKAIQKHASQNQRMLPVAKAMAEAGVQVEAVRLVDIGMQAKREPAVVEAGTQAGTRVVREVAEAATQAQERSVTKALAEAGVQVDYEKPPIAEAAVQAVVTSEAGAEMVNAEVQAGGAQVTKTERDLLHQLWQLLCGDRSDSAPKEYGTRGYEEAIRTVIERATETRETLAAREQDLEEALSRKEEVEKLYQQVIVKEHLNDKERLSKEEEIRALQEDLRISVKEKQAMQAELNLLQGKITTEELERKMKVLEIERLTDTEKDLREKIRKLEENISVARLDAQEARASEKVFMDKFQEMMRLKEKLQVEKSQLEESIRELTAEGVRLEDEEFEEAQELGDKRFAIAQIRSILEDQQETAERKLELISQKLVGLDG
jgi:hypothetical protein